jgi:SAM-dependent methyltransferase
MPHAVSKSEAPYILGHAEDELNRLVHQARFLGDLTEQIFNLAGLGQGMRVLDIGCGAGDVSFLAARLVGPGGAVLGVDRSHEAVALATERAASANLGNVRFQVGDVATLDLEEPVDAAVGRLVLMYLPDPAVVVRHLAQFVVPGGILAFLEFDLEGALSEPSCPTFETALHRIKQTFIRSGTDGRMGLRLGRVFEEAGLGTPNQLLTARVERGTDSQVYEQVAMVTRTLLPQMSRTGVASASDVDIDTLAERMRQEATDLGSTIVSPSLIGAWSRTPNE